MVGYMIQCEKKTEYTISVVQREGLFHIVSPEMRGRISPLSWQRFIGYLKKCFPHALNWGLYENIPVYEYGCSEDELKHAIKFFIQEELNGNVIFN
jgi:hypothetical protein